MPQAGKSQASKPKRRKTKNPSTRLIFPHQQPQSQTYTHTHKASYQTIIFTTKTNHLIFGCPSPITQTSRGTRALLKTTYGHTHAQQLQPVICSFSVIGKAEIPHLHGQDQLSLLLSSLFIDAEPDSQDLLHPLHIASANQTSIIMSKNHNYLRQAALFPCQVIQASSYGGKVLLQYSQRYTEAVPNHSSTLAKPHLQLLHNFSQESRGIFFDQTIISSGHIFVSGILRAMQELFQSHI
ncbi:hypothetical protein PG994_014540 [Apiospora phragmitis]|uniref:Uncharacterized protein n=1 Tax=Apiospora phragmitis TaxID=2905665 RepID=A0ABR1T4M3_9PEZI